MMNAQRILIGTLAAGLLLALMVGLSQAQRPEPQGGMPPLAALGTTFTYQGRLTDGDTPANGEYDFEFALYESLSGDDPVGSVITRDDVTATEGLFTVQLDFGSDAFPGDARYLEIRVRAGDSDGTYTTLDPRQALTAAPYALYSLETASHDHWGETWSADGRIGIGLTLDSDTSHGLQIASSGGSGVTVQLAGTDGLHVTSASDDGVEVRSAGLHGVNVYSTTLDGLHVTSAGYNGVFVGWAANHGVDVRAGDDGLHVFEAGGDGVYVRQAGDPSTRNPSTAPHGVEVAGAEKDGLYVGRADDDGVHVYSAGNHGVVVTSADDDGLYVVGAGDDGVYANTSRSDHEWGFTTPDKIYAGTSLASGGPLLFMTQNGDEGNLERGDVVVVSGAGAPFGESDTPAPLVQRAATGRRAPIFGVVYSRFVLSKEVEEIERNGQVEQHTSLQANSAEGPAAPGEYLLVVVMGAAQVKAESLSGDVYPGALLAVDAQGRTTMADATTATFGAVVGTIMEAPDAAQDGLVWVLVDPR